MAENEDKKTEEEIEEPQAEAAETEAVEKAAEEPAAEAEAKPAPKKKAAKAEAKPAKKAAPKKKAKTKKQAAPKAEVKVPAVKAIDVKSAELNPDVFEVEPKVGVLHDVVRAEMAAQRRGTASTKRRGEVRGGGVKPWRQKGTGRARAGSSRMPHWTGGGVTFGPKPRDYKFKVNRKVRSKAMKMALSARVREGGLRVVDNLTFEEPKTQAAVAVLAELDVTYPLLVLIGEEDMNAALAFRNLPQVGVTVTSELDVTDIMGARTVLTTKGVVQQLNDRLGGRK
jgi:large subunit ribosomal protein L4